ncbi:OLC1v1037992C1 [Oldenlandia corymbosa var. corymbosa]|uniref:OLC1v1037992C1 n=1 Tax=Oldenlandia corymbosa var. corymbosa TaxID=529605 RepID=A0AAV1CYW2_OLDCO|nr:OLC1v1037992C1 [Oldenlandia corymbosa var. corymbosa]
MASSRTQNYATLAFFLVVLASSAVGRISAANYSLNWSIPSGGAADYVTYASQQTFHVGDILVFNFPTGAHSLAIVTKQSYDSCSSSNPISLVTVGPASVNLTSSGEAYFICTFAGHCSAGQKLAINVSSAAAAAPATPPPAPSPKPVTPAPVATPPTPSAPAPSPKPAAPSPTKPAPAPAATAPTPSISAPSPAPGASVPSPAPGPGGAAPVPSPMGPSGNAPGASPGSAPAPGTPADTSPPPSAAPAPATVMATTLFLVMLVSISISNFF